MVKPVGHILVDHRASPGIPEDKARLMGYEPSLVGEGKMMEADVLMCAHCNRPVIKNPLRARERYYCMECGGSYICDECNIVRLSPDYKHLPFRKVVDLVGAGEAIAVTLGSRPLLIPTK